MPHSMAMRVEPLAMRTELSIYRPMGARLQISMKLDHRAVTGRMELPEKISTRFFSAVHSMAK